MTEKMLSPKAVITGKRPWLRLTGAIILGVAAALWLFRQPIAGLLAQSICSQQKLSCSLKISRLDFGGVTLSGLQVRNPKAPAAVLTAERLAVDLSWGSLLSPGASWIGGQDIVVRLDLSGTRPLLGDLDETVKRFSGKGGKAGPAPRLDIRNLRVIGDTLIGPVEARGRVAMHGPDAIEIELTAPAARLGFAGAKLQLAGAELRANVKGDVLSGRISLDLAKFEAPGTQLTDVRLDLAIDQSAGVLTGKGKASAREVSLKDARLVRAEADAGVESAAIDFSDFTFEQWLAGLSTLSLKASLGEGSLSGVSWASGVLTADVGAGGAHVPGGPSGGVLKFVGEKVSHKNGAVGQLTVEGEIVLTDGAAGGGGRAFTASGVARAKGAALSKAMRDDVQDLMQAPFKAALPTFAAAAARSVSRGAESFSVEAPWSFRMDDGGYDVSMLTGAALSAKSGLNAVLTATGSNAQVFTWSDRAKADTRVTGVEAPKAVGWNAAGTLKVSGGGAPAITLDLASAAGDGDNLSMAGAARLLAWKVGDDTLALEASGLEFDNAKAGGRAAGEVTGRLDGGLAGGVWKAARASGKVDAVWTPTAFTANAPRGLVISWDQGKYGGTIIGKAALHYAPRGPLAMRDGDAVVGGGTVAAFALPVSGDSFTGRAALGATAVTWRAEGGVRVNFDAAPAKFELIRQDAVTPVIINDIVGQLDLRDGWGVTATLSGGQVLDQQVTVSGLKGKVDVSGRNGALNGKLTGVSLKIADPMTQEKRRYEAATFEGQATLKGDDATFDGMFTLDGPGVQIATVSGTHSLKTAEGALTFAPTPLIFRPRGFQPSALSPLLRGPANVTGRMDISGGASWSSEGLKARALVDMQKIGFALASAGVFEGVSGKVEVADLLNVKSEPGQTITIDKVTLGLPIETGTIKFQLIGTDAIRLEGAEWPFVGGYIRVKPADFTFTADENRIIAQAVDWKLDSIVDLFKVPDLKLDGIVSGDIPVVFSTGSARIDNAVLQASQKGGVIQYGGSTGDAAAQADSNAKMLFDALKNFRYRVLKVKLNGDIAGRLILSLGLLGRNPDVLDGAEFDLNISLDSALMSLLNTTTWQDQLKSAVTTTAGSPD